MFNLMSNCCNWVSKLQQPTRNVVVLVVGLDKAGKTSCVRGMLRTPFGEMGPTHGCVHNELLIENFLVNLLDVSGSPEAQAGWQEYYSEAHGIIFVVDSGDRHRIKEAKGLLTDMLRHPRVAGKPLLIMANKQDKMNAFLGSELIEVLSLEKLVNQSQSLCHIEPCSALMVSRRWSDRKTLRGLRWLLRAVCLDYSKLCARVARDSKRPTGTKERERITKTEKAQKRNIAERTKASNPESCQVPHPQQKEPKGGNSLQPISDILKKENSIKKKMKKNVKVKRKSLKKERLNKDEQNESAKEEAEGNEVEQDHNCVKEKASSALLPKRSVKIKPKSKVDTSDHPDSLEKDKSSAFNEKREKKKKKNGVKGKRKNKINTEEMPAAYRQPADLSVTFDLYRKAILALKARQNQSLVPEQ